MEIGGREILVGLGVLLMIAILLDGYRRVRGRNYDRLRVGRRKQPIFDDRDIDDISDINGELPGKARVVEVRDKNSAEQLRRVIEENNAKNESRLTTPFREPEQELLGFGELPTPEKPIVTAQTNGGKEDEGQSTEDVIVLHLMAPLGESFSGSELLDATIKAGMRYGSQKIFHRHKHDDDTGKALFSMANSVNPGVFELNNMAGFITPGISFFMAMQDSDDPMAAFELMLETVDGIKKALGGELKDESRSALTRQTAEHYRQRIMDYNRRQMAG
jgi:cell division protein ZipA